MTRIAHRLLLASALLVAVGCARDGEESEHRTAHAGPTTSDTAGSAHAHAASDQHGAGSGEALPLRAIMQHLGVEMAGLTDALWTEDYPRLESHAAAISGHANIQREDLHRIETTLGAEVKGFEAADEAVHTAAVRLHEAAKARRLDDVVQQLGVVQRGCVTCHSQYRERLRTDRR